MVAAVAVALAASQLLFTRGNGTADPHPSLYTMRIDGTHARLFAKDAAKAVVSPSASQIAFVRDGAIWVMRRDGSQDRPVTRPPKGTHDDDPSWSPDGRTIYFTRFVAASDTGPVFAVQATGSGERQLTHPKADTGLSDEGTCDVGPSVSAAGRTLAYVEVGSCTHGAGTSIVTATVGGKRVNSGLRFPDKTFIEPLYGDVAWSPKGQELAYTVLGFEGNGFSGVYLSRRGRPPLRLAGSSGSDRFEGPAWSADGRSIVVAVSPDFWIVDVRKRTYRIVLDRTILTTDKVDSDPVWLP